MSSTAQFTAEDLRVALGVLRAAGAVFSIPEPVGALSVESVARRLDVEPAWVRRHLTEFPGWYRLPAGTGGVGQPCGAIRIPAADVLAFEDRQRSLRA